MRDVSTHENICSAQEPCIREEEEGLQELPADAPIGTCLRTYLDLDEKIIEVSMTPNRADCLSVIGVAREVAALTEDKLAMPSFAPCGLEPHETMPVRMQVIHLCCRIVVSIIFNVEVS